MHLHPILPAECIALGGRLCRQRLAQQHRCAVLNLGVALRHEAADIGAAHKLDARAIRSADKEPRRVRPIGVVVINLLVLRLVAIALLELRGEVVLQHKVNRVARVDRRNKGRARRVARREAAVAKLVAVDARALVSGAARLPRELCRE